MEGFYFTDWREWRRRRAWELYQSRWPLREIAVALDVASETVSRWIARGRRGGTGALRARPRPGRPARLSAAQRRQLPDFLWHGAEAYGFRGQVWTRARVARVIREEFGIEYTPRHVGRLLRELRWTPQTPIRRAVQRDEVAIKAWRRVQWPRLRDEARQERRTLVFADESGFYLLPGVVKTYAPRGLTPVLRERVSRDHLSVMAGMTPEGKVYTLVRHEPLTGQESIEFLIHLQHVTSRRLLVIWDGSPIHRRAAVRDFVAESRGAIRTEFLPGYAPDLNPWDEGGWNHLKHAELRNVAFADLEELHQGFHLAVARLHQKPHLIQSFFAQAGLIL